MEDSSEWIEDWWKDTESSKEDAMENYVGHEEQVSTKAGKEIPWRYDKGKGLENMFPEESDFQTDTKRIHYGLDV